jgi:hypothetical protein
VIKQQDILNFNPNKNTMDKGQKKQYKKIGLIALAVVVLAGGIMLLGQSDLFQGKLQLFPKKPTLQIGGIYKSNDTPPKPVSGVVSGVPTVIASNVPSQVGPSIVVSQVPSGIITPVASGVYLSPIAAAKVNVNALPTLTSDVLKKLAKEDLVKNPAKYRLTNEQKRNMINLYMRNLKK